MSTTMLRAWHSLGVNKTVNIAVTAASQLLVLPDTPTGTRCVRLVNSGTAITFIDLVDNITQAASLTTSVPLLPNKEYYMTFGNDKVGIAVIGTVGNTLYATPGEGLSST